MSITQAKQKSDFAARVKKIHRGGETTAGQSHAGIHDDGTTRVFGTPKLRKTVKKQRRLATAALGFGIGLGAALGGELLYQKLAAYPSVEIGRALGKLAEFGAEAHLPMVFAFVLAMSGIIIAGMRGKLALIAAALGCLALPELRAAQASGLDLAALTAPLAQWMQG